MEQEEEGSNMPMMQRLSDIVSIRAVKNERNQMVLEIEFRFIKQHLVFDDHNKAKELEAAIKELANPLMQEKGEVQKLPKFYKNGKSSPEP